MLRPSFAVVESIVSSMQQSAYWTIDSTQLWHNLLHGSLNISYLKGVSVFSLSADSFQAAEEGVDWYICVPHHQYSHAMSVIHTLTA